MVGDTVEAQPHPAVEPVGGDEKFRLIPHRALVVADAGFGEEVVEARRRGHLARRAR